MAVENLVVHAIRYNDKSLGFQYRFRFFNSEEERDRTYLLLTSEQEMGYGERLTPVGMVIRIEEQTVTPPNTRHPEPSLF